MLEKYLPLMLMLVIGFSVALIFLALAEWLGARRRAMGKYTTYESGITPVGAARDRFTIKFYMVAVSFIVFDLEVIFLYPWAVSFGSLGLASFLAMMIFIATLFAGYFYELKKGGFEWE
ncbi:MAG: NADH-quinone oxidoreductase subunit A [Chloroflexota bacterium]